MVNVSCPLITTSATEVVGTQIGDALVPGKFYIAQVIASDYTLKFRETGGKDKSKNRAERRETKRSEIQ
jgi:hypothetical protein